MMKTLRLTEGSASLFLLYAPSLIGKSETAADSQRARLYIKSNKDETKSCLVALSDDELRAVADWIDEFLKRRADGTLKEEDW